MFMTGVSLLAVLAAFGGLVAAGLWLKVATTADRAGDVAVRANRRALSLAAVATAIAFVLASASVLVGEVAGSL